MRSLALFDVATAGTVGGRRGDGWDVYGAQKADEEARERRRWLGRKEIDIDSSSAGTT
jgi:hypothetical protein